MLYSIKMRSSRGGCHGEGGRHISGAERIVSGDELEEAALSMIRRARSHSRGAPDFIQLKVEMVDRADAALCPLLPLYRRKAETPEEGRRAALEELIRAGVSPEAAKEGLRQLAALSDSMRGAMVLDAGSGRRLDGEGARGIRCSGMDAEDSGAYESWMRARGLGGDHPREALVLASKVASAPGTVAELCWSDDPQYVTGYVGSPALGYGRIPVMKNRGDPVGGRIFFVRPGTDITRYKDYIENRTVLVRLPESVGKGGTQDETFRTDRHAG